MKDAQVQTNRVIVNISQHQDEETTKKYLKRIAYFLQLTLPTQPFLDLTAVDPQAPVSPRPLDLFPDRPQEFLTDMADKIAIPANDVGVVGALVRNDPRRPGGKKYDTVVILLKEHQKDFEEKITQLKEFLKR